MEQAKAESVSPYQRRSSHITDASTFVITPSDVGSQAVRPGVAVQLEQERAVLLLTAKLILGRVRTGNVPLGETYVEALRSAIRVAEAGKAANNT